MRDDALNQYLDTLAGPEPALQQEAAAFALLHAPQAPGMASTPAQGRLLHFLVRLTGAKSILEMGAFTGYSTLWMADALPAGSRITIIERDLRLDGWLNNLFARHPNGTRIQVCMGEIAEVLPALPGTFDFIFIDADKRAYHEHLELALDRLTEGGLIVLDNVLHRGLVHQPAPEGEKDDKFAAYFRDFNQKLANDERLEVSFLPLREGLALVRRNS